MILGKKIGMTQVFDEEGVVTPVTVLEAGPMYVTQIKTIETDGYNAIQVGFLDQKAHRVNKPLTGHFEKAGVSVKKILREIPVENPEDYTLGQEIKADVVEAGMMVDVTGVSKGKGTAGTIKRYNHGRGPETHGSKYHRAAGSLGAASYPARVIKGMKMAGRMGHETVTIQNLEVVRVDADRNLILIKGAVPGPRGGVVSLKKTVKASK